MVNDVAKLTDSIRRSVVHQRARASLHELSDAEKIQLREQLNQEGQAFYSDKRGNRYRIERKPA